MSNKEKKKDTDDPKLCNVKLLQTVWLMLPQSKAKDHI